MTGGKVRGEKFQLSGNYDERVVWLTEATSFSGCWTSMKLAYGLFSSLGGHTEDQERLVPSRRTRRGWCPYGGPGEVGDHTEDQERLRCIGTTSVPLSVTGC